MCVFNTAEGSLAVPVSLLTLKARLHFGPREGQHTMIMARMNILFCSNTFYHPAGARNNGRILHLRSNKVSVVRYHLATKNWVVRQLCPTSTLCIAMPVDGVVHCCWRWYVAVVKPGCQSVHASVHAGKLVMVGGQGRADGVGKEVWSLDLVSMTWQQPPSAHQQWTTVQAACAPLGRSKARSPLMRTFPLGMQLCYPTLLLAQCFGICSGMVGSWRSACVPP